MTKRLPILVTFAAMLCAGAAWAQNAVPLLQPHKYFVDGSGNPCVGCMLNTYLAGTTTPTPTYTDSSMTTQNPNPVIMDATGQANIWLNPAITYKFVLQNALGTTLWTADNVSAAGGGSSVSVCGPASTIQIANSSVNGLTCDPNITINTSNHTLLVGGAVSGPHFTLQNLASIPTSWTFDVTTPATALASLAPIPLTDMATQAADTFLGNATASAALPTAVSIPNCALGITYSSHAWSCITPATVPLALSNLATQAADTVVMNASGSVAAPAAVAMPNCATGLTYNTTTHALGCNATVDEYWSFTGCTISSGSNLVSCSTSATLPTTMPDTSYTVTCTANTFNASSMSASVGSALSVGGFLVVETQIMSNGAGGSTPAIYCHAHHN